MSTTSPNELEIKAGATINGGARHLNWSGIPIEHIAEGIERQMVVGEGLMICRFVLRPFWLLLSTNIRMSRCRSS
ncbi:MAG TPA: hypothetical protein DCK99_14830 [Blastocatellia bacterium]|nr:hypothetical protein [Blastocatellia bacterium]